MSLFDINYPLFVKQLLPGTMRKTVMWRWLLILIAPVVYTYTMFTTNRTANIYNLVHTSQVVSMQAVLNDAFDNPLRRITIVDDQIFDPIYIGLDAENQPAYLSTDAENQPVYMCTDNEALIGRYDFIVQVPGSITYDIAYMRALINKYRLPAKSNYLIKNI